MTTATEFINLVREVVADSKRPDNPETTEILTTNAVTKRLGLTARAVRFYSELGIADPIRRGTSRLFTPKQVRRLQLARELRGIGMDVKSVIDTLDALSRSGSESEKLQALSRRFVNHAEELQRRAAEIRDQHKFTTVLAEQLSA
jgi:DNA-binding transcriptional MerR regulator